MSKVTKNKYTLFFNILRDGLVTYLKNLDTFVRYMLFPVFGQVLGIIIIFSVTYTFVMHIPTLIKSNPVFDNMYLIFFLHIILLFPGFFIFCKSFFDFLIAYGSLNSMAYVARGGKMKNKALDTKTHDDILKKRLFSFICLWIILSIYIIIALFPLFTIPMLVIAILFSLVFQVFMLEENNSLLRTFKRSIEMVKENYILVLALLTVSFLITYLLIPSIFVWALNTVGFVKYVSIPVAKFIATLPVIDIINDINNLFLTYTTHVLIDTSNIPAFLVNSIIAAVVTALMLPLRSCWFTVLYKNLDVPEVR